MIVDAFCHVPSERMALKFTSAACATVTNSHKIQYWLRRDGGLSSVRNTTPHLIFRHTVGHPLAADHITSTSGVPSTIDFTSFFVSYISFVFKFMGTRRVFG